MARNAQHREDLLRDATAMVTRIRWYHPDGQELFVGLRVNGAVSCYFGQDDVAHFNTQGELRRAFWNGQLIKSDAGTLVCMRRENKLEATILHSRTLSVEEASIAIKGLETNLAMLHAVLNGKNDARLDGAVPSEEVAVDALLNWITGLKRPIAIASSPHVG